MISIQTHDFDLATEYASLRKQSPCGAIVTFAGIVREFVSVSDTAPCSQTLTIEHYPGMAESVIQHFIERAKSRWHINTIRVIHRVGSLQPDQQIVFVGVSSKHRSDAFDACQYVMDKLKSEAPLWKKENNRWLESKDSDTQASQRWD